MAEPAHSGGTPDLFVSYASADRGRVLPIIERLEAAGVTVWIDRDGISGGASYALEIAEAIEQARAILLMCSEASLSSRNVKQEIALGWRFEKPYLPLLLEPVEIPKDVAYWMEAAQWVEVLGQPESVWFPKLSDALVRFGIEPTVTASITIRERPLLVGREREQGVLRTQLDAMLAGRGSLVLIGGEAGIGKTTLVEDLAIDAEEQGALVLWGHAYDLSVTRPYGPWLEMGAAYPSDERLPPLPSFIGSAVEVAALGSADRLNAEIVAFYLAVARVRPLVLVLDDLHWFDEASLDLLRALARLISTHRILILCTFRSDEIHRHHRLFEFLPLLVREAHAIRVDVPRLDDDARRALIAARYALPVEETNRLAAYLARRSEGNPLYAEELLNALEQDGFLARTNDRWRLGEITEVHVPTLLRQVIETRLKHFAPATYSLLQVGAVIGQEVPIDLWQKVTDASDELLIAALEQGREARVLEEGADGTTWRFRHALIREALYEEVIAFRRRIWHRQIAEVRAKLPNPDPDLVAYHFQQAGDARAVDWLLQAAARANHAFAARMAAERLEAVLALYQEQGRSPTSYYKLLYAIGALRRYASDPQTIAYLTEAATAAREAGDLVMAVLADAEQGFSLFLLGEFRDGLAMVERAVDEGFRLLTQNPDVMKGSIGPIDLLKTDSYVSHFAGRTAIRPVFLAYVGRLGEAIELATPFTELIDKSIERDELLPNFLWHDGVPYGTANLVHGIAVAYAALGQTERARQTFSAADRQFRAANQLHVTLGTRFLALSMFTLPYYPADLVAATQFVTAAWSESRGVLPESLERRIVELPLLVLTGHWQDANAIAREARGRIGAWMNEQINEATIAPVLRYQGRRPDAWRAVASLFPDGAQTEPGNAVLLAAVPLQRLAAALSLDSGDFPAARAWLEAHDRWLEWSGSVLGRAEGALGWAEYHHANDDAAQAWVSAGQAFAHASEPRQPLALIAVHRFLGRLGTEATEYASSEEHLMQSLALADACAAPFERALTLLELARLRVAEGRPDDACALLAEVRNICEPLEAAPTLERVALLEHTLESGGQEPRHV